ncbi:MAG: TIR domain-containing protein [Lachnospiraceae bacterium]|nr:TIR domain-containing protein [Lachnospiraceae bacterium]
MSTQFKPYEGKKPFIYISYSQARLGEVEETLQLLYNRRYRIWYDEGIPTGSEWSSCSERHLRDCGTVLFFLSSESLSSSICFSEIKTATLLKKHILILRLDASAVPDYWLVVLHDGIFLPVHGTGSSGDRHLSAAGRAALAASRLQLAVTPDDLARAVTDSHQLSAVYLRKRLENLNPAPVAFVLSALLLAVSAGTLYGLFTGRIDLFGRNPGPPNLPTYTRDEQMGIHGEVDTERWRSELTGEIAFPDTLQEKAVRSRLNESGETISMERLMEIRELYFCGDMTADRLTEINCTDGIWTVNTAEPGYGIITDLSLIRDMPVLEMLWLDLQPVTDISALSGHLLLRELSLAGCGRLDLAQLKDLPSLTALHLEYSGIDDLTPLRSLPSLITVTVSADMLPLNIPSGSGFEVVLVK